MINIDADGIKQCTYKRMFYKLTEQQFERLRELRRKIVETVNEAVYTGKWSVDVSCEEFDIVEIVVIEL